MFSFRGRAMRLPSSGTSALARQYKHLLAMSPILMQYNSFPTVRLLEPGPMMLHAVCSTSGPIASSTPTPYVPARCFQRACFYFWFSLSVAPEFMRCVPYSVLVLYQISFVCLFSLVAGNCTWEQRSIGCLRLSRQLEWRPGWMDFQTPNPYYP